uniref:phosphatidylinositol-specific phospholipase C/glycerophosphodiester phosphodiesterase family protein n=1 Tax=Roseivirga sp. TaxID=1964215 RepID=UPI00404884B8
MKTFFTFSALISLGLLNGFGQSIPLKNAHAHNDYEHERPLLDALENGFISVEADVYLIDNELFVYHDRPEKPSQERTLEKLYLKPLLERVKANNGYVYPNFHDFFYLMIDFKTDGESTYNALKPLLHNYKSILSVVENGSREMDKPVLIFISGNRPIQTMLSEEISLATLDGRPSDLGKGIAAEKMPVISQNFNQFSRWNGEGEMPDEDQLKITDLINTAHAEGKKVRLWAIPDIPNAWQTLMDLGIDFINTDQLVEFSQFMKKRD